MGHKRANVFLRRTFKIWAVHRSWILNKEVSKDKHVSDDKKDLIVLIFGHQQLSGLHGKLNSSCFVRLALGSLGDPTKVHSRRHSCELNCFAANSPCIEERCQSDQKFSFLCLCHSPFPRKFEFGFVWTGHVPILRQRLAQAQNRNTFALLSKLLSFVLVFCHYFARRNWLSEGELISN